MNRLFFLTLFLLTRLSAYSQSSSGQRDYNAPLRFDENKILQGDVLIGSYGYRIVSATQEQLIEVHDLTGKVVAYISVKKDPVLIGASVLTIRAASNEKVKVFGNETDTGWLYRKGIAWVVQNGYLGKSTDVKPMVAFSQEPLPEVEVPSRFLEIREPDQKADKPFFTTLMVSVNSSQTKMSIVSGEMLVKGGLYNQNVRTRIVNLDAGKIAETSDSTSVSFYKDYTFITNMTSIKGKWLKLEEIIVPVCIKSDVTGQETCFGTPPVGFRYSGPISDRGMIGFEYKKADKEICVFERSGSETSIKFKLDIAAGARATDDGKKIYGLYTFKSKLWAEHDRIQEEKFTEPEPGPSASEKEKKAWERRRAEFAEDKNKRIGKFYKSIDNDVNKLGKIKNYGLKVFNAETGQKEMDVQLPDIELAFFVEILPDGRIFVKHFITENNKRSGEAIVYSPDGSKVLARMKGLDADILMSNGTIIASKTNHALSISNTGMIKVFDINSGKLIKQLNDGAPGKTMSPTSPPVYLSVNDGFVLIPYSNGMVSLFSLKVMKVVAELFVTPNDWAILARDGRFDGSLAALDQLEWREYDGDKITARMSVASAFDGYYTPRLFNAILMGEQGQQVAPITDKKAALVPILRAKSIDNQPLTVSDNGITKFKTGKKNLTIDFVVTANNDKVNEIRLHNNGKLVGVQKRSATGAYKFDLKLNSVFGETNAVYAIASGTDGFDSEKAKVWISYSGSDSQPAKLYALIVGVNEYKNPKYKLNYAYVDAESINKQIASSNSELFKQVEVTTLFDGQANKANILQAIKTISTKMKEQDVFLFYFAGHGTMGMIDGKDEFFIVPFDVTQLYGDEIQLSAKAISASELKVISSQLNAQKQIFILDACNSGGALDAAGTRGAAEERAVAQLARSTGSYWLTASGSDQFATEFKQLGHGVFTYSLLEAIEGKNKSLTSDGVLTMRELSSFVEQRVPELSQQYKGKPQYPASFSIGNDFPLLIYKVN